MKLSGNASRMSKIRESAIRYHERKTILGRLYTDLDRGRQVRALPGQLAQAMLVTLGHADSLEAHGG